MSVIIKGMEMPTTCCDCEFKEWFIDSAYCRLTEMDMEYEESNNCRHPDCPLVELPEKHGRLIDADALLTKTINNPLRAPYIVERDIQDMPTVVEAEGEK